MECYSWHSAQDLCSKTRLSTLCKYCFFSALDPDPHFMKILKQADNSLFEPEKNKRLMTKYTGSKQAFSSLFAILFRTEIDNRAPFLIPA